MAAIGVIFAAFSIGVVASNKTLLQSVSVKASSKTDSVHLNIIFQTSMESPTVASSLAEDKYVSRPDLEFQIKSIATALIPTCYHIVYGPKGVGKSELVSHSVRETKGPVKKFRVTQTTSMKELIVLVMKQLTGETVPDFDSSDFDALLDKFIAEKKVIPTFIFDVERGSNTSPDTYKVLRSFAKSLLGRCHCIIVLSEASDVLEFTGDEDRERFVYIDEMRRGEADELLKKYGANFTEAERNYIYDNVGTRAARLINLVYDFKNTKPPDVKLHPKMPRWQRSSLRAAN